jgi:sugar/nucleoside kinase (ribokinase family)
MLRESKIQMEPAGDGARANGKVGGRPQYGHDGGALILLPLLIIWNSVVNRIWAIDRYGGKIRTRTRRSPGGFGWEALRQALALGFKVIVATAHGLDAAGDFLESELRKAGVDLRGLRRVPRPTATAEVISKSDDGERTILIEDGVPTALWTPDPSDHQLFGDAGFILVGGTLDDEVLSIVLHLAREHGRPVAINPTRVRRLMGLDLDGVVLVQVSRPDLPNFGFDRDASAREVAAPFLDLGAKAVCITDDADPESVVTSDGHSFKIPSVPRRHPLYPTGTGDSSFVGRVAGVIRFGPDRLEEAFGVGSLAGGFFIEHGRPGAWAELEALGCEWPIDQR